MDALASPMFAQAITPAFSTTCGQAAVAGPRASRP
jgi:hypothetical protein